MVAPRIAYSDNHGSHMGFKKSKHHSCISNLSFIVRIVGPSFEQ